MSADTKNVKSILACTDPEGGWTGGLDPPPLKYHKIIGVLSNIDLQGLKNHKATKPAFNVWLSLACQGNAIMKYHALFLLKTRKDVAKFVVCCSRDWHFKG